jgi:hypothetical protein
MHNPFLAAVVVLSTSSLLWTLWGNAPALVRYYTYSWATLFPLIAAPIFLLYLTAVASGGGGDGSAIIAVTTMVPTTFALLGGTVLGIVPALMLTVFLAVIGSPSAR